MTAASIELLACRWGSYSIWNYDTLSSPFWRLYWNSCKGWSVSLDGKIVPLEPGHIVLIPPNTPCRARSEKEAAHFHIHFILESLFNPYEPGIYPLPFSRKNESLVSALMVSDASRPEDDFLRTLKAKYLCYDCLVRLPRSSLRILRYSPKILSAIQAMAQNLSQPLSNQEIAMALGMNTNAFIRLFHQELHQAPQKWRMERRIRKASVMLSHSGLSIEAIAEQTGFCDRAHFSRVFSELKAMGPSAYRKRMRKQA
jgi:AraC-like DNA-binding protein